MCVFMGRRVRVNLTMDEDVVRRAKELGLNLSKVCERALIRAIKALEQAEGQTNSNSFTKNSSYVDRAGFEPATSTLQGWRSYP